VFGQVHCLVSVVGHVVGWLAGKEGVVGDGLETQLLLRVLPVPLFVYPVKLVPLLHR
jgi:hypothetical protein